MVREGRTLVQRTEERARLNRLLADSPIGLVQVLQEYLADSTGTTLLLVVDQFGEVFTNVPRIRHGDSSPRWRIWAAQICRCIY